MFGNNKKYAVFRTAPGFYFSKGGYVSATGAIEINRDTVEISCVYKTISKVKMFE